MNNKAKITARAWFDGEPKHYELKGQNARTLHALVQVGRAGITPLDVSNTWAFRLSAYIHNLRHDYALDIQTLKEEHDGGWHGRYVLHTPVEILSVD